MVFLRMPTEMLEMPRRYRHLPLPVSALKITLRKGARRGGGKGAC